MTPLLSAVTYLAVLTPWLNTFSLSPPAPHNRSEIEAIADHYKTRSAEQPWFWLAQRLPVMPLPPSDGNRRLPTSRTELSVAGKTLRDNDSIRNVLGRTSSQIGFEGRVANGSSANLAHGSPRPSPRTSDPIGRLGPPRQHLAPGVETTRGETTHDDSWHFGASAPSAAGSHGSEVQDPLSRGGMPVNAFSKLFDQGEGVNARVATKSPAKQKQLPLQLPTTHVHKEQLIPKAFPGRSSLLISALVPIAHRAKQELKNQTSLMPRVKRSSPYYDNKGVETFADDYVSNSIMEASYVDEIPYDIRSSPKLLSLFELPLREHDVSKYFALLDLNREQKVKLNPRVINEMTADDSDSENLDADLSQEQQLDDSSASLETLATLSRPEDQEDQRDPTDDPGGSDDHTVLLDRFEAGKAIPQYLSVLHRLAEALLAVFNASGSGDAGLPRLAPSSGLDLDRRRLSPGPTRQAARSAGKLPVRSSLASDLALSSRKKGYNQLPPVLAESLRFLPRPPTTDRKGAGDVTEPDGSPLLDDELPVSVLWAWLLLLQQGDGDSGGPLPEVSAAKRDIKDRGALVRKLHNPFTLMSLRPVTATRQQSQREMERQAAEKKQSTVLRGWALARPLQLLHPLGPGRTTASITSSSSLSYDTVRQSPTRQAPRFRSARPRAPVRKVAESLRRTRRVQASRRARPDWPSRA